MEGGRWKGHEAFIRCVRRGREEGRENGRRDGWVKGVWSGQIRSCQVREGVGG